MDRLPSGSGACCLPNVDGITYIKIGPQGQTVGMRGLDTIFQQLFAMGRRPEDASDAELVGMARKFNWIADKASIEGDYAVAVRMQLSLPAGRKRRELSANKAYSCCRGGQYAKHSISPPIPKPI